MLRAQVANLDLSAGRKNALMTRLNDASASLAAGDTIATRSSLIAFLNRVQIFNQNGHLDDPTTVLLENQAATLLLVIP